MLGPANFATDRRGLGERVGGSGGRVRVVTDYLHYWFVNLFSWLCVSVGGWVMGVVSRINQFCVHSGFNIITNDSMFCT